MAEWPFKRLSVGNTAGAKPQSSGLVRVQASRRDAERVRLEGDGRGARRSSDRLSRTVPSTKAGGSARPLKCPGRLRQPDGQSGSRRGRRNHRIQPRRDRRMMPPYRPRSKHSTRPRRPGPWKTRARVAARPWRGRGEAWCENERVEVSSQPQQRPADLQMRRSTAARATMTPSCAEILCMRSVSGSPLAAAMMSPSRIRGATSAMRSFGM